MLASQLKVIAALSPVTRSKNLEIAEDRKYIINFPGSSGNDKTTSYIKSNIATMEANCWMDGVVIQPSYSDPNDGFSSYISKISRTYEIPSNLLEWQPAEMSSTAFKIFTKNFVRANLAEPGTADLFNATDATSFVNNAKASVAMASTGGAVGVLWDMEAYSNSVFWKHASQSHGQTFAATQAKYREIGFRLMKESIAIMPACHFLIAVSYEQMTTVSATSPSSSKYGLLGSFLDGLHDAAPRTATLICLQEEGYGNILQSWFDADFESQTPPYVPSLQSQNYLNVHEHSMSVALDYPFSGFDYSTPDNNGITPAQFEAAFDKIFAVAPRYATVYTQQPKFYNYTGGVNEMPAAYKTRLLNAKMKSFRNLVAFWNPASLTLSNDDPVSTFTDSGPNAIAATNSGGNRPLFKTSGIASGIPSINYTRASSQCLNAHGLAPWICQNKGEYTIVCVCKSSSTSPGVTQYVCGFGASSNANTNLSIGTSIAQRWITERINDSGTGTRVSSSSYITSPAATSPCVFSARSTGTTSLIRVNGTGVDASTAQSISQQSFDQFALGAIAKNTTVNFWDGDIGLIAIFNRYLSTSELQWIERVFGYISGVTVA